MNGSAINAPTPLSRGRLRFEAPLVLLVGLIVTMLAMLGMLGMLGMSGMLGEVDDRIWQCDAAR